MNVQPYHLNFNGVVNPGRNRLPKIGFPLLYAFVIIRRDRRRIVSIAVTSYPTVEWIARQITDASHWQEAPHAPRP